MIEAVGFEKDGAFYPAIAVAGEVVWTNHIQHNNAYSARCDAESKLKKIIGKLIWDSEPK